MQEKKEFKKAVVEVIRFEKNDVISTSGGLQTITVTAEGIQGGIPNPPPIPMP